MESPYKRAPDSPSRQLLRELGRLSASEQQHLYERLDINGEAQEHLHRQALEHAAAEHARIRREAEVEQKRLEAQKELEREKKLQNDLRETERLRREREDAEQSIRREVEAAEAAKRRFEEERRAEEAAKARREREEKERAAAEEARREEEEAARKRMAAEAETKAKAAAQEALRKKNQANTPKPPTPKPPTPKLSTPKPPTQATPAKAPAPSAAAAANLGKEQQDAEQQHQRYLQIWRKLKELRSFLKDYAKSNQDFKKEMGNARRVIRKCVGQLVTDSSNPQANQKPNVEIRDAIRDSRKFTEPQVPISDFLLAPSADLTQPMMPAILLYLVHIFAKCLIAQFIGEVAIAPKTASTIGITGATIFGNADCQWNGIGLIDVFIAKYHRVCPVLFGIYGSESTKSGRERLGWWHTDATKTTFVTAQRHYERMTGLGAGFAALSLRSFKNRAAPFPSWHYWHALARILNVPRDQVTDTHLVVLKSMVENNESRVLELFGRAGMAVLRVALREFPEQVPQRNDVAAKALLLIPDVLRTERRLFL